MHEATRNLLTTLAQLDEETLDACYGIESDSDAPLDVAIFAWRDAGCPDVADIEPTDDPDSETLDGEETP